MGVGGDSFREEKMEDVGVMAASPGEIVTLVWTELTLDNYFS